MRQDEPVIAFATDANGLLPLVVTASGVVRRARQIPVHIRVVHDGIDGGVLARLGKLLSACGAASFVAIRFDASRLAGLRPVQHLPVMCYARLLLPELLPDIDRVLYLDNDLLFCRDVNDLWQTWSALYPVGAVSDAGIDRLGDTHCLAYCRDELPDPSLPAFNSGVLMMDLQQWRQQGFVALAFDFLHKYHDRLNSADQDALNFVFAGRCQMFDAGWNVPQFLAWNTDTELVSRASEGFKPYISTAPREGAVYHLYGRHKPWNSGPRHPARLAWLDELASCGWFGRTGMMRFRAADDVRAWTFAFKSKLTAAKPQTVEVVAV